MAHSVRNRIFKFGNLQNAQTAGLPADMYGHTSRLYPFQSKPTALKMSSSDAGDTLPMNIEGLDKNKFIVTQKKDLNGHTPVDLDGLWFRQYICYNDDAGVPLVGTVYIYEADASVIDGVPQEAEKIKIVVKPAYQRTMMLVYTTPIDYVCRLKNVRVGIVPKSASSVYGTVGIFTRPPGKAFTCQGYSGLITSGTSVDEINISGMSDVQPFTDIVVRVIEASANGIEFQGSFNLDFTRKIKV